MKVANKNNLDTVEMFATKFVTSHRQTRL